MIKKLIGILVVTLLIGAIILPVNGQTTMQLINKINTKNIFLEQNSQPLNVVIDELILTQMSGLHIPGLSATIIKNQDVFWTKSYGYANISNDQLVENTTLFYLASITKTITATAIMQLYEDDYLDLDDPINDYLPFNVHHPTHSTDITFKMRRIS